MGAAVLPAIIGAGGSVLGSAIGGNAQKSAAQDQANAQTSLANAQEQNLAQNEANYRNQVSSLLPYLTSFSNASNIARGQGHYTAPNPMTSGGGIFGGQHVTSGANQAPSPGPGGGGALGPAIGAPGMFGMPMRSLLAQFSQSGVSQ